MLSHLDYYWKDFELGRLAFFLGCLILNVAVIVLMGFLPEASLAKVIVGISGYAAVIVLARARVRNFGGSDLKWTIYLALVALLLFAGIPVAFHAGFSADETKVIARIIIYALLLGPNLYLIFKRPLY